MKSCLTSLRCLHSLRFLRHAVVLACAGLLAACGAATSASDPVRRAPHTATHVLAVGQSVAITPTETLKLDRVNDSRCHTGAVCVWAGYVSYSFTLSNHTGSTPLLLSESMPGGSATATRQNLVVTLIGADPATPPTLQAPLPDYRVTVKVTQNQ